MRLALAVLLILVLSGCRQESYTDPYIAAVDNYLASLDTAEAAGTPVDPPPKPAYLECPVQPESLPNSPGTSIGVMGGTGFGLTGDTISSTAAMGRLSTRSQAQCESINTARRQAYEKAMQRYQQVVAGEKVESEGNDG